MKIKNPDLTNSTQKAIAGIGIGVVLLLLWFLLPPLIVIMTNIWIAIALAAPLLLGILFRDVIWEEAKRLSWELTKKHISSNKLWYMWRGYEYLVGRNADLENDIKKISTVRIQNEHRMVEIVRDLKGAKEEAIRKEGSPAPVLKVLRNKVALLEEQFNSMSPRTDMMKKQEGDLQEIYQNRLADTEILKQTLEAKEQELEMMKIMNDATKSASAWLQDTPRMKVFKESLKQIDKDISSYTANVENFQKNILPTISSGSSGLEAEGVALIEEYKKERLLLN